MSNEQWTFTVPGIPKGQARPRFARVGKFVRTYDPASAVANKATIAQYAIAAGVKQIDGPVAVEILAVLPRPKRLCRKCDPDGMVHAPCKPDADNIAKAVGDALIGVAYADDASVCALNVCKVYHGKGGMPKTVVTVRGVNAVTAPENSCGIPLDGGAGVG